MGAEPLDEPDPPPSPAARARAGSHGEDEITRFYLTRHPDLVVFLLWQGASAADAADCAHEAILQACEHWPDLRHPYTWCRTVAWRALRLRRGRREQPVEDCAALSSEPAGESALDEFEQRHHLLAMARRHLNPEHREVIAWSFDGATPTEIAAALGVPAPTVRRRLCDARRKLQAVWDHEEEGHPDEL